MSEAGIAPSGGLFNPVTSIVEKQEKQKKKKHNSNKLRLQGRELPLNQPIREKTGTERQTDRDTVDLCLPAYGYYCEAAAWSVTAIPMMLEMHVFIRFFSLFT